MRRIRLSSALAIELRKDLPASAPLRILSGANSRLRQQRIRGLSYEMEEDLGQLTKISYRGTLLGIAATRPLVRLVSGKDPFELSGFCFRNCKRTIIYDNFGSHPLLSNVSHLYSDTVVLETAMRKDLNSVHCLIESEHCTHDYRFMLSGKNFGRLEHGIDDKESFVLFPIWNRSLEKYLHGQISSEMQVLKGVLYFSRKGNIKDGFSSDWFRPRSPIF